MLNGKYDGEPIKKRSNPHVGSRFWLGVSKHFCNPLHLSDFVSTWGSVTSSVVSDNKPPKTVNSTWGCQGRPGGWPFLLLESYFCSEAAEGFPKWSSALAKTIGANPKESKKCVKIHLSPLRWLCDQQKTDKRGFSGKPRLAKTVTIGVVGRNLNHARSYRALFNWSQAF